MATTASHHADTTSGIGSLTIGQFIDPDSLLDDPKRFQKQVKRERFIAIMFYISLFVLIIGVFGFCIGYLVSATQLAASGLLTTMQAVLKGTYTFLVLNKLMMSIYGVYTFYRYGGTKALIEHLQRSADIIARQADALEIQANALANSVVVLNQTAATAEEDQAKLDEIVTLGSQIGRLATKIGSTEEVNIDPLLDDVQMLQKEVQIIRRQIDKNKMLQKYYEVELNDGRTGMSKEEYELFLDSLDKQTRDLWWEIASWKKLRKRRNSADQLVVNVDEFQLKLDELFEKMEQQDRNTNNTIDEITKQ